MNDTMHERASTLGAEWKDEGQGYFSMVARSPSMFMSVELAYIALPLAHPGCNKHYNDLSPDVNGGLTFSRENVFGWDYLHYTNESTPSEDIPSALSYFRERELGGAL